MMNKKTEFRKNFENFCRIFNDERSFIIPLTNVNMKSAEDLRNDGKLIIEKAAILTRINYMIHAQKIFSIDELSACFRDVKSVNIAQSLRMFTRPNHKDRYSQVIQYFVENPTIFAQVIYFNFVYNIKDNEDYNNLVDDKKFFCYSTIPAMYLFFLTKEMQSSALSFITNLFKLHFYLHSPHFGKSHQFLKDIIFCFFVSTNPSNFFNTSILPIIASFFLYIDEVKFEYSKSLNRSLYWTKIITFVTKILERMKNSTSLLPETAKLLISTIIDICGDNTTLKYELIINSLICRYMKCYVDTPTDLVLNDSVTVIQCICGLPTLLSEETRFLIKEMKFEIEEFIDSMKLKTQINESVTKAIKYAGCMTLITSRDLSLIYKYTDFFKKCITKSNKKEESEKICSILNGIDPPAKNNDSEYFQLRVSSTENRFEHEKSLPTAPYDEIIDLINTINLSDIQFETAEELQQQLFRFCSFQLNSSIKQKITTEVLSNTKQAIFNIRTNHNKLVELSDSLSSALFVISNEIKKFEDQYSLIINVVIKRMIIPALIDQYPCEFLFNHRDIFSPCNSYDRLIETVNKRIGYLNVTKENEARLNKSFFEDFIDQIDIAFNFQLKVKTDQVSNLLAKFVKMNSGILSSVGNQRQKLIKRASNHFQFIKTYYKISFNLRMALSATNLISLLPDDALLLAIAMSENPAIFSFIYFTNSYLKDERIANVILTPDEKILLNKLRKACQYLRDGNYRAISIV